MWRSAMAIPTAFAMPWPRGPVVVSTPGVSPYSGCPGVLEPHCLKFLRSSISLNYCLQQNTIDNVLIGIDSLSQLKDNIQSLNYKIKPEAINEISTIRVQNLDLLNPSLWN